MNHTQVMDLVGVVKQLKRGDFGKELVISGDPYGSIIYTDFELVYEASNKRFVVYPRGEAVLTYEKNDGEDHKDGTEATGRGA